MKTSPRRSGFSSSRREKNFISDARYTSIKKRLYLYTFQTQDIHVLLHRVTHILKKPEMDTKSRNWPVLLQADLVSVSGFFTPPVVNRHLTVEELSEP